MNIEEAKTKIERLEQVAARISEISSIAIATWAWIYSGHLAALMEQDLWGPEIKNGMVLSAGHSIHVLAFMGLAILIRHAIRPVGTIVLDLAWKEFRIAAGQQVFEGLPCDSCSPPLAQPQRRTAWTILRENARHTRHIWKQGRKFGYHTCCILAFCRDITLGRSPVHHRGLCIPGGLPEEPGALLEGEFVPCQRHAKMHRRQGNHYRVS